MGFSVTASNVIFVVALLGAGSVASSAMLSTWKDVDRSTQERDERVQSLVQTSIAFQSAPIHDAGLEEYTVSLKNVGATQLRVSELVYVLDGVVHESVVAQGVEGNAATDLWLPGETLTVTLGSVGSEPTHVRIITGQGVSAYYPG